MLDEQFGEDPPRGDSQDELSKTPKTVEELGVSVAAPEAE